MELSDIKCSVCPYKGKMAAAIEKICDEYCKFPWEMTQEELDKKCESCPLQVMI